MLLEPPAIDYAENLQIGKEGSFQKRPGFDLLTSVPTPSGDPFLLRSVGDRLFTLDDQSVRSFNGTSWNTVASKATIGTLAIEIDGQANHGLSMPQYVADQRANPELNKKFIVYDIQERTGGHWDAEIELRRHVVIAIYDKDNRFIEQIRIDDAHSPQVFVGASGFATLFYAEQDDDEMRHPIRMRNLSLGPGSDLTLSQSILVDVTQGYPLLEMGEGSLGPRNPRLGQGSDYEAKYHASYSSGAGRFVFTYQSNRYGYVRTIADDGTVGNAIQIDAIKGTTVLGVATWHDASFTGIYLLFAAWDALESTPGQTFAWKVAIWRGLISHVNPDLIIYRDTYSITSSVYNPFTLSGPSHAPTVTHGTIAVNDAVVADDIKLFVAYGTAGKSNYPGYLLPAPPDTHEHWVYARDPEAGLRWYIYSAEPNVIADDFNQVNSHRLTTNAVYRDGEWLVGIQQWIDATPYGDVDSFTGGGDDVPNGWVSIIQGVKPVSTVLCAFKTGEKAAVPVASIDSGQSGLCDANEGETRTHLGVLLLDENDELLVSNRVIITAASVAMELSRGPSGESYPVFRNVRSQTPANALCRVHRFRFGHGSSNEIHSSAFGDAIVVSTGLPLWLNEGIAAEFSPLDSPEILAVKLTHGNTLTMVEAPMQDVADPDAAWHKIAVVIGYTDAGGNVHRSAPSTTMYVLGGTTAEIYITPPLTVLPDTHEYWCEVYFSSASDTAPFLAGSTAYKISGTSVRRILMTYSVTVDYDESSVLFVVPSSSPLLFTEGDVLAPDPWPVSRASTVTSTRLWTLDPINRGRVYYSKLFEDYIAPEFNQSLSLVLGDERRLTAIGSFDDKVVVFEPSRIHVIYGEGPDNRGQGQDFAVHYIATDVGCEDQQSIVETPIGLVFYHAPRGFYLLDRNLQVHFIGAGVEDLAYDIDVVAATLDPSKGEVLFLVQPNQTISEDGPDPDTSLVTRPPRPIFQNVLPANSCLSFNYEDKQWMLWTNYEGRATTLHQQRYTRLLSNWDIWQESEDFWTDPTGTNRTLLRTPWIKLSESIQNYERLWKLKFLGRYLSSLKGIGDDMYEAGDIVVRLYFDYEKDYSQEKRFRMQDFGYNVFNHFPKRGERLQFELAPKRGRCQAVKIEIEEVNTDYMEDGIYYGLGRGFEISAIDLEIGLGPSLSLLPKAVKK
jgi:hypothetical protein